MSGAPSKISYSKELNNSDKACNLLRQKVAEGKLGIKTGEGFFVYTDEMKGKATHDFQKRLVATIQSQ